MVLDLGNEVEFRIMVEYEIIVGVAAEEKQRCNGGRGFSSCFLSSLSQLPNYKPDSKTRIE